MFGRQFPQRCTKKRSASARCITHPPFVRVIRFTMRNQYLMQLTIKLERDGLNVPAVKEIIREECTKLTKVKDLKKTSVIIDVDPY